VIILGGGQQMNTSRSFFAEQHANRRRTVVFASLTAVWMLAVGFWAVFLQYVLLGLMAAQFGVYPALLASDTPFVTSLWGAAGALALWATAATFLFFRSSSIVPRAVGAGPPIGSDAMRLTRSLNRVLLASGNAASTPAVFVWPIDSPNAFAAGRSVRDGSIVVSRGLLTLCDDGELDAVLAHELAHLHNGDALHVTQAVCAATAVLLVLYLGATLAVVVGAITAAIIALIVNIADEDDSGIGCLLAIFGVFYALSFGLASLVIVSVVFVPITLIAGTAIRCAASGLSQSREFLADACSAQWTRNPAKLASVLRKIDGNVNTLPIRGAVVAPLLLAENRVGGPRAKLKLFDDFFTRGGWSQFFGFLLRSHPPARMRALLLDQMAGFDLAGWRPPPVGFAQRSRQVIAVIIPAVLVAAAIAAVPWRPQARTVWFPQPPVAQQSSEAWVRAEIAADRVRLRQRAKTDAAIIGELARGTPVLARRRISSGESGGNWVEVSLDGRTVSGWVAAQFIRAK